MPNAEQQLLQWTCDSVFVELDVRGKFINSQHLVHILSTFKNAIPHCFRILFPVITYPLFFKKKNSYPRVPFHLKKVILFKEFLTEQQTRLFLFFTKKGYQIFSDHLNFFDQKLMN